MRRGFGAPYPTDHYMVGEYGGNSGFSNTTGKVSATVSPDGTTTGLFIVAGQSNAGNHLAGAVGYSLTNPTKVLEVNIYDGAGYRCDPEAALGCTGNAWNWFSDLGDKLVIAGIFQRVIFVPCSVAGTSIVQWGTTTSGVVRTKLEVAIKRARICGMSVSGIIWQQGESDPGTSQAAYEAGLNDLLNVAQGYGCFAPFFLAKSTMNGGVTSTNIRNAIDARIAANPTYFKAGADTDTLTGTTGSDPNRQGDNTHLTITGGRSNADLWKTALDVVF